MCGFVIVYAKSPSGMPDEPALARMESLLQHRGPDERGQHFRSPVSMVHRRLSIIDLDGGHQPMVSPDGQVRIVFNGEIYNYRQLSDRLRAEGTSVQGTSDTEVLLAAYLTWGEACLAELNGMFAFVIHDGRDNSLFAARDRFGEKPLYLHDTPESIVIASELKAIVHHGTAGLHIDRFALYSYFTTGYVHGSRSIFRGIRRLGAGCALRYRTGQIHEWRYWSPPMPSEEIRDSSTADAALSELLSNAVQLRMVADVPVGFFLSGGIDSSAVVALASEVANSRLETFCIGFNESKYDEREYARFVAEKFGARHHEFVLKPQGIEVIEELVWHLDEPFADSSALPTWFLSAETRRHVKVALSGDGGDEMFAGYDVYRGHYLSERLRIVPRPLLHMVAALLRELPAFEADARTGLERLARNIADAALPYGERFVAKQQIFRRGFLAEAAPALTELATPETDRYLFAPLFNPSVPPLAAIALWQQTVSLVDDMLVKVDRTSMAHSLEVRAPLLDHRIAEFVNRVSFSVKLPHGRTKSLLKTYLQRYFPEEFLWRRKQGFVVPLNHWFKEGLNDYLRDQLLAPGARVRHVFRPEMIERLLSEHIRLIRDHSRMLWALLMFEVWCRRFGIDAGAITNA